MFKYFLYKIGQFLASRFPLKVSYRIGVFLSDMQYVFSFRDRRSVKNNLKKIAHLNGKIDESTRQVFRNFGIYLTEFLRMDKLVTDDFIRDRVKLQNVEAVHEALKHGKGGIILSAHIGNWEMGGAVIARLGFPFMAVALPHKDRPVNDLFNYQREVHGVIVVPANIAVRRCIEQLRSNKLVALVGDRDFGQHGEVLDFLGGKAVIPKGPAIFSAKTGAPAIPSFFIRNPDNTFTFHFSDPIYPPSNMMNQEDILNLMKKHVAAIEDIIHRYPTQWLMFREFDVK
ncbi:MAG: lysophospholipid acyltransferase family protein [Candidatus Omnitrophica bacterium]|nr:lysophospholipid acyltransferase family protein [Candidatus Omnitrophota bacterium]